MWNMFYFITLEDMNIFRFVYMRRQIFHQWKQNVSLSRMLLASRNGRKKQFSKFGQV